MVEHKERNRLTSMSFKRSDCAIACVLDLLGDKWTLLIIRDLFFGKTRYKDFHESNEKIPTNILAGRLAKLEKAGLITKTPYQKNPVRYDYRLTKTGQSLGPVMRAIAHWGSEYISGTRTQIATGRK